MKVKIKKFKTLQDLELKVPAEISGGNGIGKTTILEAISFVLTGKDLNGSEFKQVYDNRVDLHDALADVSFFDDYGNEFRRTVEPKFTTSRSGVEELKILRSTRCRKNDIDTNDFSDEFIDFYKFGTDFFFNQKEADQRAIFIDLMKSLLPNFDVKSAQLSVKSLKKTQKETVQEIDAIKKMLKEITNKEIPNIPEFVEAKEKEYQKILSARDDNKAHIERINERNNKTLFAWREEKNYLEGEISSNELKLKRFESEIEQINKNIESTTATSFAGFEKVSTSSFEDKLKELESKLKKLTYYDDLNSYAQKYGMKNPVVAENMKRIQALNNATPDNLPDGEEVTDVCFNCGQKSEEVLAKGVENIIKSLKAENKQILTREMREVSGSYLDVKDERDRLLDQINRIEKENQKNEERAEKLKRAFDIQKTNELGKIKIKLEEAEGLVFIVEKKQKQLQEELSKLVEPTLEELPTELSISDELMQAHLDYQRLRDEVIGAKAVNENNAKIKEIKEVEIKEKRKLLLELDTQILELQKQITDYFSNLTKVVKNEFKGKMQIGVQLQEYVITQDDYKDCFKITADDKVFPHETNGAMLNNVKLQILAGLQKLKGYKGITIMDNAEANTTEPVDPCGLNLVVAMATYDDKLIIK